MLPILPLILLVQGCPDIERAECNYNETRRCGGGYDENGCELSSRCIPMYNGMIGTDGTECFSSCPCDETKGQVYCPFSSYNGCESGTCAYPNGDCPARCSYPCNSDEVACNNGIDCGGCWMGYRCMKSNSACPVTCSIACKYEIGEQWCDHGYDENGCWMGNHCASKCPSDCPPVTTVQCNSDETKCGGIRGGLDANGCKMAETCISWMNGVGYDGYDCPNSCPIFCDRNEGQTYCEWPSYNGCPRIGYCAYSQTRGIDGKPCPGICQTRCEGAGAMNCNSGYDANGCWLGFYCSTNCS